MYQCLVTVMIREQDLFDVSPAFYTLSCTYLLLVFSGDIDTHIQWYILSVSTSQLELITMVPKSQLILLFSLIVL